MNLTTCVDQQDTGKLLGFIDAGAEHRAFKTL